MEELINIIMNICDTIFFPFNLKKDSKKLLPPIPGEP
jgi:hypothetical protein